MHTGKSDSQQTTRSTKGNKKENTWERYKCQELVLGANKIQKRTRYRDKHTRTKKTLKICAYLICNLAHLFGDWKKSLKLFKKQQRTCYIIFIHAFYSRVKQS